MPPEYELVREWLKIAARDLRVAHVLLNMEPASCEDVGFHCQQAFEKLLKGFLTHHHVHFEKIHDLDILLNQ